MILNGNNEWKNRQILYKSRLFQFQIFGMYCEINSFTFQCRILCTYDTSWYFISVEKYLHFSHLNLLYFHYLPIFSSLATIDLST